jgi:hypothetical protein
VVLEYLYTIEVYAFFFQTSIQLEQGIGFLLELPAINNPKSVVREICGIYTSLVAKKI